MWERTHDSLMALSHRITHLSDLLSVPRCYVRRPFWLYFGTIVGGGLNDSGPLCLGSPCLAYRFVHINSLNWIWIWTSTRLTTAAKGEASVTPPLGLPPKQRHVSFLRLHRAEFLFRLLHCLRLTQQHTTVSIDKKGQNENENGSSAYLV